MNQRFLLWGLASIGFVLTLAVSAAAADSQVVQNAPYTARPATRVVAH